jgi:MFS family permease
LKRLGASSIEIGFTNSVLSLVGILFSAPTGWVVDRIKNVKKTYIASLGLGLVFYPVLVLTRNWQLFMWVSLWLAITSMLILPARRIIDIDSLSNKDRVQGLSIHRMITAIGGTVGPLIAAYIITYFGGVGYADSYRPLWIFWSVNSIVIFIIVWKYLDDVIFERGEERVGFLKSFYTIFRGSSALKILLFKDVIQSFFMLMSTPFLGIYQVDVKMATAFILGYMGVGEMVVDVFLSIPMGGVISRFGRRRIAYIGHLVGVLARSIIFLTPPTHPELLIMYSVLGSVEGCMYLGWDAFYQETVPQEVRGKYLGVRNVIVGLIGVFAPILGAVIWNFNPHYLWYLNTLQWALIAFPLMIILMQKYGSEASDREER